MIATSVPIGDDRASQFSSAFYNALAEGRGIREAFAAGSALLEGKYGDAGVAFVHRGTDWEGDDEEDFEAPVLEWSLYEQPDSEADLETWRLPDARSDWEVQLSDGDGPVRQLDGSPNVLSYRSPKRTASVLACANCGTRISLAGEEQQSCPICASDEVQSTSAVTRVADERVPFAISERDARARLADIAGDGDIDINLHAVFVPHWIIDVDTRSHFEAERGVVRDFTAQPFKVEWEAITGDVDLALEDSMVRAGNVPVGRDVAGQDWYWELDAAQALEADEARDVVFDKPLQSAFDDVAARLRDELDAEIAETVGGHEQRNISRDTRYRRLAARAVLLPCWYASIEREEGRAGFVINGQTGAVRALRLPGMVQWQDGDNDMSKRTYEPGQASVKTSLAASVYSGVGIGLMVGLLLGMSAPSAKSTVGIFIGAVGVALAALLGLNDKHFSTAKGLRIGSFGLAVVLAAPAGIYARDHGLFSPSLKTRVEEITKMNFTKEQALDYLARIQAPANNAKAGDADNYVNAFANIGKSALYAGEVEIDDCDSLRVSRPNDGETTFKQMHKTLSQKGPGWEKVANMAQTQLEDPDRLLALFIARDAACGMGEFAPKLELTVADCQSLKSGTPLRANSSSGMRILLERVNEELTPSGQANGLDLLHLALCSKQ